MRNLQSGGNAKYRWLLPQAGLMCLMLAATPSAMAEYNKNSTPPLASAMITTCRLGNAPLTQGSTPTSIAGVTIVSPQQAKCLMDSFPDSVLVIAAMPDAVQLPDAYPVPILGAAAADAKFTARVATEFTPLTGGNKARPIMVYCHHASCQYSANAAEHLVNMGYTRVFWLRDGTSGWQKAGYSFATKSRVPAGYSESVFNFQQAGNFTFACFGEEKVPACRNKISFAYKSLTAADTKPTDKPLILDDLLNTIAVTAGYLRTGGRDGKATKDPKGGLELIADGYTLMRAAERDGSHPNVFANNQKLQREAVLAFTEAGRSADAAAVLQDARTRADGDFASLETVRSDKKKLSARLGNLIGAEQLEREVAAYWSKRAETHYKAGNKAEGARALALAQAAYARGATWITRLDKEGVAGFAEQPGPVRLATLRNNQGDLLMAAGSKPAALEAYRAASKSSCGYVNEKTASEIRAGKPISDLNQYPFARACLDAEIGASKADGSFERDIAKQVDDEMRAQYELLGLDYDKIKNKKK